MRLSNKSTFSLVCIILLMAFVASPVMANTMSAVWSGDLDTTNEETNESGWVVTLTYATAPTIANAPEVGDFTVTPSGVATVTNIAPAAGTTPAVTDTDTVFTFNVALADTSQGDDADVTINETSGNTIASRRVTLTNGQDLASTSIYQPKIKSIKAPQSAKQFDLLDVVIEFEAMAAAVTGPPAVPAIGPAIGLRRTDINATNGTVQSVVSSGANKYTAKVLMAATSTTISVTTTAFPFQARGATEPVIEGANDTIVFDEVAPTLTTVMLESATEFDLDAYPAEINENFRIVVTAATDGPEEAATFDLTYDVATSIPERATAKFLGKKDGNPVYEIELLKNTTAGNWPVADLTIIVTVTDIAGNSAVHRSTRVKLAARATTPTAATIPTLALGMTTAGGTLTVTFSKDPGTVTVPAGYSITASGAARTITVPATQGAGSHSVALTWDNDGSGTVTYTIPAIVVNASPEFTIAADSFVVVVRNATAGKIAALEAHNPDIVLVVWADMPDLQNVFDTTAVTGGGALILDQAGDSSAMGYVARSPGTVGISEVMWAIDESELGNALVQRTNQWVEIHNLNVDTTDDATPGTDDGSVTVRLSWKTGAATISTDATINGNLASPKLDVVTNVFNDRPGNAFWVLPGQNGNPDTGQNFVSMARVPKRGAFSLTRRHENNAGKARDGLYTRYGDGGAGGANQSLDGRNKGSWAASTTPYARFSQNIGVGLGSVVHDFLGTPGRVNTFSPERADTRAARTNVPINSVVFNEIANRTNEDYEWIELRDVRPDNPTDEINLKNYLISIVESKPAQANRNKTSDGNDKIFYQFPSNDNAKIPAGGVFLLVASDPRDNPDHPLAVGYNVDLDDEDQVVGSRKNPVRYKVMRKSDQAAYQYEDIGLPDSGKFILILRRPDGGQGHRSGAHGGEGVAERGKDDLDKIVDIAGWHDDLKITNYPNAVSETNLWPLRNFEALNFNQNQFSQETVHYRRNLVTRGSHNDHRAAFNGVGYTGVGYKRQASNSAAHGGSPGYHANTTGKAADNKVIISEIMLSQGDGRTPLPQWIELYNPSKTHAVNLADNAGWRLVIENPDRAPIITINFKDDGNVKVIPPNQTVLIVSSSARDYGSDTLPRGTVFPTTRVLNAFTAIRGETFELASRTSPLLDPAGFNLRLMDGKTTDNKPASRYIGEISDEIGSLDGNPRTNDEPAWEFPSGMTEDGNRTSLIRYFVEGVAQDGMMPMNWTRAADTAGFAQLFVRHTWYGDETDYGTPADRTGSVLPVSLSHFRPTLEDGKVVVRWTTESELDNAGFNILRSDSRNGEFAQVNDTLIQGKGTTGERSTYSWVDASAKPGVVYYYQIEDVSFAGERQTLRTTKLKGYISAENKLTTTWGDLKEVQ